MENEVKKEAGEEVRGGQEKRRADKIQHSGKMCTHTHTHLAVTCVRTQ